jgi:hypothetical protein
MENKWEGVELRRLTERAKEKEKKNHFRMKRDIQILMLKNCKNHYKKFFQMAA